MEGGERGVQGRPEDLLPEERASLGRGRHFRRHFPAVPLSPPSGLRPMAARSYGGTTWKDLASSCNTCRHPFPWSQGGGHSDSACMSWRLARLNACQPDIRLHAVLRGFIMRKRPIAARTLLWTKLMRKQFEGETSALFSNKCS